jgi:hypothetical protein
MSTTPVSVSDLSICDRTVCSDPFACTPITNTDPYAVCDVLPIGWSAYFCNVDKCCHSLGCVMLMGSLSIKEAKAHHAYYFRLSQESGLRDVEPLGDGTYKCMVADCKRRSCAAKTALNCNDACEHHVYYLGVYAHDLMMKRL